MKRFLSLLAGGLLVVAAASTSNAQVSFNQIKLGTGANILTLSGPASGGSDSYAFPPISGSSKQVMTTAGSQNIDGTVTASVDNSVISGLMLTPSYNDNAHTGVLHSTLTLGKSGAAGTLFMSDATGDYAIFSPGVLSANQTYTLPNATGTLALTSDITGAISGTTNRISKFTSANAIGDSKLSDDGSNLTYNSLFNVSSTGAVSGATGLSSSGTVTFSALNSAGVVHNDALGNLSTGTVNLATEVAGLLPGTNGGTGVNNGTNTLTFGANVNRGSNALTLTTTGVTNVTLPTSGTLATTGGSVQYGGSNTALATATTKLFDVAYTDVTTTGNLAGAAITSDGSASSGAVNVSATGLTVGAVGKGTGAVTALVVTATGGTGTKKAIDASGAIVSNSLVQGATLVANNAASGLTVGNGATATVLTSTASAARAINFPNADGTLALTSDLTGAISGTTNRISKFTSANAIGDSKLSDDGSNLTYNSTFNVSTAGAVTGATGITSSGTITFSGLSTQGIVHNAASGQLSTGAVDLASNGAGGDVTGVLKAVNGGTGVNNGTNTITLGGNLTTAGATTIGTGTNTVALNTTGNTSVTLPTSGTLATTDGSVQYGGSNATLTTGTTKLFNVSYGAIGASASTAGASITSDASAGANADVPATGLSVSSIAKGTGASTALTLSATGGTGTLKALEVTAGTSSFAGDVSLGANLKGYGPNKFADIATLTGTGALQNFTVANSNVSATSCIIVTAKVSSTGNHYIPVLESVGAGSFTVNLSGVPAAAETVALSYIIVN